MDCSTPGFPVLHYLPEFDQIHVHWVHDAIQPSYTLSPSSPSVLSLSQHQDLFQWLCSLCWYPSIGASASASVLPMNIHGWFPWELIDLISLLSKDSQESSPTPQFKNINSLALSLLFIVQLSHLYMTTGKTTALTIWTFVSKVMSLLFNMLSRFVTALLPRSKCLLISWVQSPSAVILDPKKRKSVTASTFSPSIGHQVMGSDAMIFIFWMLSFKSAFHSPLSPLSRGYFSFSLLSAIRVLLSASLRLLIILSVNLIPACDSSSIHSSSTSFLMMYSAYKLNKQGDNIQPRYTLFPILNKSVVPCPVLTVVILFLIENY